MKHVLMVFLFAACFTGFAQTNISGDISGTWTTANSPYLIVGNVTIQQGSLLTIEPGVEIRFTGQFVFTINGTIIANGTISDSIIFTRNSATEASRGRGIEFINSNSDTNELTYCVIEYGKKNGSGNGGSGGGILINNSNVLVNNCTIRNNNASSNGGGISIYKSSNNYTVLKNCTVQNNTVGGGNSSSDGGAGVYASGYGASSGIIANNLIIDNIDDRTGAPNSEGGGGILLSGGDFKVSNNTIYGNSSPKGCGILTRDDYEGEIVNNIVWGNVGSGNDEQIAIETGWYPGGTIPANLNISYNCIQEEGIVVVYRNTLNNIEYTSGINNFQQNPLFINTTESNFHLLNNSPCINTGNPATDTTLFSVDMDSNIRIYNDTIDIGAYEYQFTADSLVANFYTNHTEGDTSSTIKFTDLSIGIPTNWSWDFNSDGTIDSYERNPEYVFNSPGTYSVTLTCEDSTQQSTKTKTSYITIYPKEDWSEFFADTIPHKRWYHKMAYCGNGHVLLFGGNWESGWDWSYDNRTWIYNVNDSTWTNMHTPNPPSGRSLHSMAYLGGDMVLLYGGNNGSNETWIYDYSDNSWTNKTSSITPLTTYGADMSYLDHGKILLFGGYGGLNQNGRNDETVIYDLSTNTWEKQTPLNNVKPVAREGYGMAYMGNGQVLLFAGELWNYQRNNETWIYSYTDNSWTQKFPTVSPSARSYFGMASIGNKKALVFSGGGGSDETWVYSLDSNQWSQRTYQHFKPSARYGVDISEASMNGSSNPILFAGNSNNQPLKDCWIFDSGDSISPELTASFIGYNHEGVYPRFVQFEDLSFDYVTSWQWDFDNDGTFDSYIQKPSFTYNTPGKYSVKLVVSDGTNYDTLIRTDYINVVNLIPRFVSDTTMMYVGESIQFTDSTIGVPTSWQWDFGDGATSTVQNPSHAYQDTGTYSVSLTVGDVYGDTTLVKTNLIHIFPSNHVWGTISENTTWCLDTIFVAGNVFLTNSKTLTICPGTVILFQGHFKINIQGTLIAEGTVNDSITFTAEDTFTGWHGLRFNDTPASNDSSIINYCNFRYGKAINDSTNSYGSGGAIYVYKYDKIRIENSHFTYNNSAVDGGCIYLREADIKIINSLFDYNTAREAGAIMVSESAAMLDRLILVNNVVDAEWYSSGGALYFGGYQSNAVVSNCLISNNTATQSAGGVYMWACSPLLINNTIVKNKVTDSYSYGGAIFSNGATPTIKNSIIWGNEASSYSQIRGNISSMEYTDIQGGGFPGTGNIDSDPKFMNPVNGAGNQYSGSANGWKLRYGSPCINRGDPLTDTSVYKKDLRGKKRIQMQFIDIGCYENGLQWTGESGSEWNNSGNWFEGNVPTDSSNVTITNFAINSPVISSDVTINSLWMEDSAVLTVSPPSILTITQNFLTTNQQPNQPNSPVPINGSIGQYINTSLLWSCSDPEGDVLTYDVYFGTAATPPLVATEQSDTIYNPGTLVDSTTYFWKIIAHDNYGNTTEGSIWQFICFSNQPPNQPISPIPADSSLNQSLSVDLHWFCSDPDGDTLTYDVYFGNNSNPVLVASAITDTTYDPGTLNYNSTYFWKIVAHDNHSNSTVGDFWQFTCISNQPPTQPASPIPADSAQNQSLTVDLHWSCSDPEGDSLTYDVYFSTDTIPILVASAITDTTYDPGTLNYDSTYFWKIVAHDNHNNTSVGDIWQFTCISNQPPAQPTSPIPADSAQNQSPIVNLHWSCSDPEGDSLTYDVYFSTDTIPILVASAITDTTYDPGTLDYDSVYYWKIIVHDDHGHISTGDIWQFVTVDSIWQQCGDAIVDFRDGQVYNTVLIGNQCWMAENLNIGTRIDSNSNQTNNSTIEKYCYQDDIANCNTYGGLYQWDEMMQYITTEGTQGICPTGWHLPTDAEWMTLEEEADSTTGVINWYTNGFRGTDAGGNLKETGTTHWAFPNAGATNSSDFMALPGGYKNGNGSFSSLGNDGNWWSSSKNSSIEAWYRSLYYFIGKSYRLYTHKGLGFSVRCIKNPNQPPAQPTSPIPADSAQNQSPIVNLHWSCSDPEGDSLTYDVYFSTDTIPVLVASAITDTTYDPGTLDYDSVYYWKIIVHDNHGHISTGDIWQFVTVDSVWQQCGDAIVDLRDGQVYNTVLIGNQCWMTENLNVGIIISGYGSNNQTNNNIIEKYCYEDNTNNCDIYGGLYQWDEMMQYTTDTAVQGICPTGWHLPTDNEWKILEGTVDSQYPVGDPEWDGGGNRGYDAGYNLKSTSGWGTGANGSNAYNFNALPGGYRYYHGYFTNPNIANFWSSSETTIYGYSWARRLTSGNEIMRDYYSKGNGYSVRCIKNPNQPPAQPTSPIPVDSSQNQSTTVNLHWSCSDPEGDSLTYDVYFSTDTIPVLVASAITDTTYDPGTLNYDSTYFWKIVAHDNHNNSTAGDVWQFTTETQTTSWQCGDILVDSRDGQSYTTVQIGTQCWMAANLNIGIRIDGVNDQTNNSTIEKYCYDNDTANCDTYGGLYQWDEMMQYVTTEGTQGICPTGWHLPTDSEWKTMEMHLGMTQAQADSIGVRGTDEGGKMKEIGTTNWISPNTGATNSSNFSGLPGAYRYNDGTFYDIGKQAVFWSSNENASNAFYRLLYYSFSQVYRNIEIKAAGFSVRCLKNPNQPPAQPTSPIPVDSSQNQSTTVNLHWSCSDPESDSLTYDVYFSTDTIPVLVASAITDTTYNPGTLNYDSTYFWKIVAHDNHNNTTTGDIWQFTTETQTTSWQCGDILVDLRDGQSYTTVQIGTQCWMAENLNVGTRIDGSSNQTDNGTIEKYCYDDNTANCDTYGGLYQWDEMMQYVTTEGSQGICPTGWHLPTDNEWKTMEIHLGMTQAGADGTGYRGLDEGSKLGGNEPLWTNGDLDQNANFGTSGFTGLPGDYRNTTGSFSSLSYNAFFWSSSESGPYALNRFLDYNITQVGRNYSSKAYGFSIRCVRD